MDLRKSANVFEIEEDGTIFITGKNGSAEEAKKIVEEMTHEYKQGEKYQGEVIRIVDFGAFVKIGHNAEGLVHVSEMAPFRIENVRDYLKEGDIVPTMVKEIDQIFSRKNKNKKKTASPKGDAVFFLFRTSFSYRM